jgi:DNA-binding NtrC family response regulator
MNNRVLILEDDAVIAWDIESELESRGWQIAGIKAKASDTLPLMAELRPDASVLDINLGKENSFDVARECIRLGIAAVFMSGESGDALPDDLKNITICSKPVDYDRLHTALEQALDAL